MRNDSRLKFQRAHSNDMDSSHPPKSVLVVDDEPDIALTIRAILERFGHHVTCVLDGELALKRIAANSYDVIITDIIMPDVDGARLIREARRLGSQARIVAISGGGSFMASGDVLTMAQKLGAAAIVQKPFTPPQLMSAVFPETSAALNHP